MKNIKNLGLALAQKYFEKSSENIMINIFVNDITKYKKYELLNAYEMLEVLKIALDRVSEEYTTEQLEDAFYSFSTCI